MSDQPSAAGAPIDGAALCAGFVDSLPVDGASVVLFGLDGQHSTIGSSDATATRMDSIQFELQEGPHWSVLATGTVVACPDLDGTAGHIWPLFSKAAVQLGIASVFSFPMKIGNALVGAVDLYGSHAKVLESRDLGIAIYLANQIAPTAVNLALRSANESEPADRASAPYLRREVHQATGIVQSQLKITTGDAFARLRAHAFATGLPIEVIAKDVVERRLDFTTLDD